MCIYLNLVRSTGALRARLLLVLADVQIVLTISIMAGLFIFIVSSVGASCSQTLSPYACMVSQIAVPVYFIKDNATMIGYEIADGFVG